MKYVNQLNQVAQICEAISKNAQKLQNCSVAARSVKAKNSGVNSTIIRVSQEIESYGRILCQMSEVLETGNRTYSKCEENLAKLTGTSLEFQTGKSTTNVVEVSEDYLDNHEHADVSDYISTIAKFVGEFGVAGGLFSAVTTWFGGEGSPKDIISGGKYLLKAIGTGAVGISKGGKDGAKYVVGWYDGFSEIDTSSFGKAFKSSLVKQKNQMDLSKASNAGTKVRAVTKWAGHLLTIAGNAYENFTDEFEKDEWGRALGETIIESGVDIAVGIGATALSTAVIAALGFTAPAAIVGIGAVGITLGANAICKWATGGKDLGEAAADSVYWIGEKAADCAQWIGDKVSDGCKAIKCEVANIVTAPWRGICNMFA